MRCFRPFVLPVLEYYFACGARLLIHTFGFGHVVSGANFLPGGVRKCNLSHRRLDEVLGMLCKTRSNPMHQLCGVVLPVPFVTVQVTGGALVTRRYSYAPPRLRTSQYRMIFILSSASLWNDLVDGVFDGVGLVVFSIWNNASLLTCAAVTIFGSDSYLFLFLSCICVGWGWGLWTDRVHPLSPSLQCRLFEILIIIGHSMFS